MTSDERIEIAARLRKTRGIMAFVEALGIDFDSDWCWTDVSRRVSDLIDPTCEIEYVAPIEHFEPDKTKINIGYYFKLTCGHGVIRPYKDTPPAFCDECGARVVDDD